MFLSIIRLTCDQTATTLELLRSADALMRERDDVEIRMVDNGRTPVEPAIRAEGFGWTDRLHIIANGENRGVAAGRNQGLRAAEGEVMMILDNDTIVTPEAVLGLAQYVAEHQQCGVAGPTLVSADGVVQDSAKPFPSPWLKLRHTVGVKGLTGREREAMESGHPTYVIGACQAFRRDTLKRVGWLDEGIFYGPEDADFCLRVGRLGLTVDYRPEFRIIHHWRRATRRSPFSSLALKHAKGLLRFYLRHLFR